MAVYVDELFDTQGLSPRWPFDQACHLTADTLEELHAFATNLAMKRSWF